MRAAKTLCALGLLASLGLTGCISVQHDRDYPDYGGNYDDDYGPPPYAPAHGYRYYRQDVYHVYDAPTGVYVINGYPHHYYDGGWYYRYTRGYWERCPRLRGGHWSRTDHHYVPQRLYGRYQGGRPGKSWKHDDRDDHRDWKREQREERKEDRRDRVEQRRDDRDNHRDSRHEQRAERKQDRHDRVDQHHERRDQRVDQRHEQRVERKQDRHERREERREDKRERRGEELAGRTQ